MKVIKTVQLALTEEERKAIKTVYRMLYGLEYEEEKVVANELEYDDLAPIRTDLVLLYELGGGCESDLKKEI